MRSRFSSAIVPSLIVISFAVVATATRPAKKETESAKPATALKVRDQLQKVGHPMFVSPHSNPIAVTGDLVFVVNTPSDTVDVIDAKSREVKTRINVGIDPCSIAVRPDGKEVWVSNHISDSVSVIDNNPDSPTHLQVVATIQEFGATSKATRFDEPVGIAFANNEKAYVALSSENEIAVIDVAERKIQRRLKITAQDPRAIFVRGDRLYVLPFESNNKTQLSGGRGDQIDGDLVTFDAYQHSIVHNNVLSLGHVVDIVKNPRVPDRDLYVFDTKTDKLVKTVDTLGTLLYGLTVDSKGNVFIAQTDARNEVNGRAGTKKHGLKELENRAFLNQITKVSFSEAEKEKPKVDFIDLEPLPPKQPEPGSALATPFAIQVSDDDKTLVVSAAGSDKLFTVDAASGAVLGRISVGAVPRGIALSNADDGTANNAWVYNAVANTVSVVELKDKSEPKVVGFVPLEDPTDRVVKLGRTWFNDADASTTGTFSCASCHPDGHTDQLLWVLKTPVVSGGNQIMPRSTMPIRGLRDTAPFHWDGIPGDPYGGNNSQAIWGDVKPNCDVNDPYSAPRHLIDGGLASTMHMMENKTINDEGKGGLLTASQRDEMAAFLLSVPYPPAQRRAYDNVLSKRAQRGYRLFHIEGDFQGGPQPNVCGDCHRMPFLVSTNTPGTGMDAPTWRGAYDRFLILPQGRLNIIEFDFYRRVAEQGIPERSVWQFSWAGRRRFDPIWDMVLENSTGFSGALGRQVTFNTTAAEDHLTTNLLASLEVSAQEGAIVLEGEGVLIEDGKPTEIAMQFAPDYKGGRYVAKTGDQEYSRDELFAMATKGEFVGTLTGRHGELDDVHHPQPAIWTYGPLEQQSGHQEFPTVYPGNQKMELSGRHVADDAYVLVDGRRVKGGVEVVNDTEEKIVVELETLPENGMHLLQVQNPRGQFSNDFIFHVAESADAAEELVAAIDSARTDSRMELARAIAANNLDDVKKILGGGKKLTLDALSNKDSVERINARNPESGTTPIHDAAIRGQMEMLKFLVKAGAKVKARNRDGNTALHSSAFLGHTETVKFLLKHGANPEQKNDRGESAIQVVSGDWNRGLEGFYRGIGRSMGMDVDIDEIKDMRPKMAKLLRDAVPGETKSESQASETKESEKADSK